MAMYVTSVTSEPGGPESGRALTRLWTPQLTLRAAQIGSMNTLYDHDGHRKYLTPAERDAFLKAADDAEVREVRTFCATLAYTGCRISEALALTADRIDLKDGTIVIESAKKRQTG